MTAPWREHLDGWPLPPVSFQLDPEKTMLVVVDVQRHAADPTVAVSTLLKERYPEIAAYYLDRLENTTLPAIHSLLDYFREHKLRVMFLCVGPWFEDRSDFSPRMRQREQGVNAETGQRILFHHGDPIHDILPELAPRDGELVLHKTTMSAFLSTGLELMLRNLGIEQLVFTGLATQACVETTARDAADLGFNCVMVDDACITFTQAAHDATLLNFAATFGRVDVAAAVIRELTAALLVPVLAASTTPTTTSS
jgi:nicotinamidase-related amidase